MKVNVIRISKGWDKIMEQLDEGQNSLAARYPETKGLLYRRIRGFLNRRQIKVSYCCSC